MILKMKRAVAPNPVLRPVGSASCLAQEASETHPLHCRIHPSSSVAPRRLGKRIPCKSARAPLLGPPGGKRVHADSTKIETLIAQLKEITAEKHKALVFSQFTSFLDIAGRALKEEKIAHVRLDGQTPHLKRQELVSRFQSDSDLSVFLISLKAGGVGLNLTAADYVFILDPWWNPAVETQAIDRSHRIGQKNKVIAYRLIAKDTVEEKIIELQKQKREIADAIISEDASLLKKLTPEDIDVLLS